MWKFIQNIKARRMNKIVNEVTGQIEEKMDFLFDDFVSKMNGALSNLTIDYDEMARYIDYSDVAYNMDASDIAEYIDSYDIAQNLDTHDIASNIDTDDIAQHFDSYTIAQEIEMSDIADYIDLDDIRQEMQDTKDEIISEVEGMISDAVDSLEVTRG